MSQLETDPMFRLKLSRAMARRFSAGNEKNDSNRAGICETVKTIIIFKRASAE